MSDGGGSVRDSLRDAHEYVFQVDFLFLEHAQLEPALDQPLGEKAAVVLSVAQRDLDDAPLIQKVHALDFRVAGHFLGRLLVPIDADRYEEHVLLAHLGDGRVDVAVEQELAAFDDTDLVANVRELGKDVARYENGLLHAPELLQELAHLDPGPGVEPAGRLVQEQYLRLVQ